jgi:fatty acid desaturase
MSPWRWFFRIVAILILPVALGSLFWIPKPQGEDSQVDNKLKRLDLIGAFLMLAAIVLLVLGLTLGASYGWKKPGFLAPFLISMVLFPTFFIWESKLPEGYALLPSATWRIKNFTILIILSLFIYSWWSLNFVPLIEIFVKVHGEKAIIAAVRVIPQSLAAMAVTALLTFYPKLVARPRWPITFGLVMSIIGYVLFSQSRTQVGNDYWRFLFPGQIIGSAGMMGVFTAVVCLPFLLRTKLMNRM